MTKNQILEKYKLRSEDFPSREVPNFVELDKALSRVDGLFTSAELRSIATAMDTLGNFERDPFYYIHPM